MRLDEELSRYHAVDCSPCDCTDDCACEGENRGYIGLVHPNCIFSIVDEANKDETPNVIMVSQPINLFELSSKANRETPAIVSALSQNGKYVFCMMNNLNELFIICSGMILIP